MNEVPTMTDQAHEERIGKTFEKKVAVQVKLQQAQLLAGPIAQQNLAKDVAVVKQSEIDAYIAAAS